MDEQDGTVRRSAAHDPLWLHPDDDLAPNRPGETLYGRLTLPAGRWRRARDRLLGRAAAADALRALLEGQQITGERLDRLSGDGWRVLHAVPLPGGDDIAHLAVGPGGVLCFRTVCHRGARLEVGAEEVRIAGRRSEPAVRGSRRDARRAAHALGRGCGFAVRVRPVLLCVGASRVEVSPAAGDVRVLREHQLGALRAEGGVLNPGVIEAVYAVARDRRTWRDL